MRPPRGTQDFLPARMAGDGIASEAVAAHEARTAALFERAGYGRIVTPMFEDAAVFQRTSGEGSDLVAKEMYEFTDRSDNHLALRAEGTAPVMRSIISNALWDSGLPVKLYYAAAMFRYDRPQKGRFRQHHQMGLEAVGTEDPAVDAEVIELGQQMLRAAGVMQTRLLLNTIGHPGCREEHGQQLVAFLEQHESELDADCQRRMRTNPLRVFDCKVEADQKILADAPLLETFLCDDCRAHFAAVRGFLDVAGVAYELTPRLVRGLDYYTRTAFEFVSDALGDGQQTAVCAGGRYDGLVELLGGPALPGIGFGSGIERVLLAATVEGAPPASAPLACFVVPLGVGERAHAVALTRAVRASGIAADMAYVSRKLGAHLKHADRIGARYTVLIGAREAEAGRGTVRDMTSGEQREIALTDIPRWLEENV